MKNRKIRKSGFLQRMMAVLLAAVLVFGTVWDNAPTSVLAQESVSENMPVDGETEQEEETETEPSGEDTKPAEGTDADEQETDEESKEETPKPEEGTGEKTPEPGEEDEKEQESVSENDAPAESVAAPRRMMRAAVAQADDTIIGGGEEAGWTLTADGRLTITSDYGMWDWKNNGVRDHQDDVKSAEIQSGVYQILTGAFGSCSKLTKIAIPESVVIIESGAFEGCSGLEEISIPGVREIQEYAFHVCDGLTKIAIPNSVESIGEGAFAGCIGLTEITIAESVQRIGNSAFDNCIQLTRVTMEGVTPPEIGNGVFSGCKFAMNEESEPGIRVPSGTAQAYKEAWTEWADYIAESTEPTDNIDEGTDWTLAKDGTLTIKTNEGMENWINGGRHDNMNNVTSVEIKDGVESIGEEAFSRCDRMKKITIPDSVESIGRYAFNGCDSLERITIPDSVESIEESTFGGCCGLTGIKISTNVKKIGVAAFSNCSNLTEITIPQSVTDIQREAFLFCSKLAKVTMEGATPPTLGSDVFSECPGITGTKSIYVPVGALEAYQGTEGKEKGWEPYKDNITDGTPPAEEHKHDGVTFTAWTQTNSLPTTAGNYYLTENVTLSNGVMPHGIRLCLNGKSISAPVTIFLISSSGVLDLYDCQKTGNITISGTSSIVSSFGTFNMYGGKINGNSKAERGGGVEVLGGTFEMHGGEISGNSARKGGGVYVGGGDFYMYGGKINGNSASDMGGGVYVEYGTFLVGGGAVISGNNCNGKANNVYLARERTIEIGTGKPLSSPASIGVTTEAEPTEGNPVDITGENSADYSQYFHSDNPEYTIVNGEGNVVQLAVKSQPHTHSLKRVEAKAATCTEDGNSAYYTCNGCDKWFLDAEGKQEITDKNSVKISKTGHSYDETTWGYKEDDGHAHVCVNCDEHDEVEAHTPGAAATTTTPQICTVCEYIIAAAIGHTCSPQSVAKVEPSCTTAGKQAYYHCEGCGKNYEDAEGKKLITDISAWGKIDVLGHDWGEWKVTKPATAEESGEKEHTCNRCGETETETIPATGGGSGGGNQGGGSGGNKPGSGGSSGGSGGSGDSGSGDNSGENSGDTGDNGGNGGADGGNGGTGGNSGGGNNGNGGAGTTAPKPGASGTGKPRVKQEKEGNVRKEVSVTGESTLDASIGTPISKLSDIVLTKEEKQQAAAGTDIRIVLDVKDASAFVSAADRKAVEAALGSAAAKGYTLGQYLEINLYKLIGNSRNVITNTNGKITVTINVPDSLKNTDRTKTRTFAVIRVHDGRATLLTDLDDKEDTITIETDRFSTYAVVYKDTAGGDGSVVRISVKSDGGRKPSGKKDDEPDTGDNTPLALGATLSMIAGLTYLLLYVTDRRWGMSEEMKKELVSRIIGWAKQGDRYRIYLALAAIFVLLVYYHSVGKKTCVEWQEVYGE